VLRLLVSRISSDVRLDAADRLAGQRWPSLWDGDPGFVL